MALTKIPASFIDTSSGISGDTTLTGNLTLTGYLAGPATFTIDPAGVGDNTGTVVIAGNLQVDGTTTTINSTTMTVDDLNITLASGAANAAAADGAGITVDGASATLTYNSTPDAWSFNKNVGIGTNSPYGVLTVKAGNNSYNGGLIIEDTDSTTRSAITHVNGTLFFSDDASNDHMVITGGNVGIGTLTPAAPIEVQKSVSGNFVARFQNTNSTTPYGVWIKEPASAANAYPSLQITDDAGTAIRLRVDSGTGNVGIGTGAPSYPLHVVGTDSSHQIRVEKTGSGNLNLGVDSTGAFIEAQTSIPLRLFTGGAESIRIDTVGNLLVGRTSSSGMIGQGMGLGTSSAGKSLTLFSSSDGNNGLIQFIDRNGASALQIGGHALHTFFYGYGSRPMIFYTNGSEAMRIDAGRNIGIGTSTPNSGGSAASWLTLSSKTLGGTTYSGGLSFDVNGINQMWIYQDTDNIFSFQGAGSNAGWKWLYGGTEYMRLTGGKLGIGTSSPSAKLEIDAGTEGQSSAVEAIRIAGPNTPNNENSAQDLKWQFDFAGSSIIRSYRGSSWDTYLTFHTTQDSAGSNSPQERMRIDHAGNVMIGTTAAKSMQSAAEKTLTVKGGMLTAYPQGPGAAYQEPRTIRDWFVYAGATNSGSTYVHMKTNLDMGTVSNYMYTMSHFRFHSAYNYTGSVRVASGMMGFHNWSNNFYQLAIHNDTSWALVHTPYISSDGKAVLVAYIEGSYASFAIDWHQWAGYPIREAKVTATTTSTSATGAY